MATRRNVFSSLLMSTTYEHSIILYYIIDDTMAEDMIVSCCTEANNSVGEECQMNRQGNVKKWTSTLSEKGR